MPLSVQQRLTREPVEAFGCASAQRAAAHCAHHDRSALCEYNSPGGRLPHQGDQGARNEQTERNLVREWSRRLGRAQGAEEGGFTLHCAPGTHHPEEYRLSCGKRRKGVNPRKQWMPPLCGRATSGGKGGMSRGKTISTNNAHRRSILAAPRTNLHSRYRATNNYDYNSTRPIRHSSEGDGLEASHTVPPPYTERRLQCDVSTGETGPTT